MSNLFKQLLKTGWIIVLLLNFSVQCDAITYYSQQSGLWTVNNTWSTVSYGSTTNTGTYPKRGDVVFIGDGHNVSMNVNSITASVTVGQGSSGSLLYSNYLTFLMVIAGNLTVNAGATFGYASNSSKTHTLFISGSIINDGNFDVYYDSNDFVNITFNSAIHSTISGVGTWDLNKVTVFKSTLTSYKVEVTIIAFENAIRELVVSYGTYIHNNKGNYQVNPLLGSFFVTQNAIFEVKSGTLHLSPNDDFLYLLGQIKVTAGTMRIGSTAGNQGLRYYSVGASIPVIDVSGGILQVYGGITFRSGYAASSLRYNQSAGSTLLNCGTTGSSIESFKINNAASSRFTISGGTIVLQKPNTSSGTFSDFDLCGASGTVTCSGGTVEFGNAFSPNNSNFNFTPYSSIVQPNFKVTGSIGNTNTLKTSNGSTSDFSLTSLNIDVNKIFDVRSITGAAGDFKNMTLVSNFDGLNTLYNNGTFTARSGTVTFQGAEGLWIGGNSTTVFNNLTLNNFFGLALAKTINISNQLLLLDGVLYATSTEKLISLAGASANLGSSISYVDGPFEQIVASASPQTLNLPVGKNGSFRPMILAVQHTNAVAVSYTSEVWNFSARTMGYALPPSLGWVSDVRYFNLTRTAVGNLSNARVTLTYGADDFVTDPNNLRVARDNGSSTWLDLGGVGTAAGSGSITSSNFNGFNTYFTLANASGGINPLPVEYTSFTALLNGKAVDLLWSTASEVNSDYFMIERSQDGKNFEAIGKVNAAGFSNSMKNYVFIDNNPKSGNNYYRLLQVDRDGKFEYSVIKVVNLKNAMMSVYPNPITDRLITVNMDENVEGTLIATLYDLSGKVVSNSMLQFSNGFNTSYTLDQNIQPGIYLFEVINSAGNKWHERLVVTL